MGIIGCYDLHLYCDHADHDAYKHRFNPGQYTGDTRAEAVRAARESGWSVDSKANRCLCPHHSGKVAARHLAAAAKGSFRCDAPGGMQQGDGQENV